MPTKVNLTKKYIGVIDISTILFHAALAGQETKLTIKHKETGHVMLMDREMEVKEEDVLPTDKRIDMSEDIQGNVLWKIIRKTPFKNVTEFYGRFKADDKIGGWLKDFNDKREAEGKEALKKSDFIVEESVELIEDCEMIAKGRFKQKIQAILDQPWCEDIIICWADSDTDNFRYELAKTQPYKAERKDKPLLFDKVTQYMLNRYHDKMSIVKGDEDDSQCVYLIQQDWIEAKGGINKLKYVMVAIDKDTKQTPQLHYNFDHPEYGVQLITPFEACYNFCYQLLVGDTTDSILGLGGLPKEYLKDKGIRYTKGLGDKTARLLLEGCTTQKELFEKVVECYKAQYGEEKVEFTAWTGEVLQRNWLDHLKEQASLLRMYADPENPIYDIEVTLKRMGIL